MQALGVSVLALGVLGLLAFAVDIALAQVRSMRRERYLDERLSNQARWR